MLWSLRGAVLGGAFDFEGLLGCIYWKHHAQCERPAMCRDLWGVLR